MPKSGASLRSQLTERNTNPQRNVASTPGVLRPGQYVHVDLIFQGVQFNPEDIFDALETKYGAGKISSDFDTLSMGNLQFRITP